jgi:hypothetical protein
MSGPATRQECDHVAEKPAHHRSHDDRPPDDLHLGEAGPEDVDPWRGAHHQQTAAAASHRSCVEADPDDRGDGCYDGGTDQGEDTRASIHLVIVDAPTAPHVHRGRAASPVAGADP